MPRIIGDPDELTTTIRHLARSDAREITQQATEKAERIRRDAWNRADRKREAILEQARDRARDIRRRRKVDVTREEKEAFLHAREELLDEVWKQAEATLRDLTEKEDAYTEVLQNLALSGVRIIGPGDRTLAADDKGQALLSKDRLLEWGRKAGEELGEQVYFKRADQPLKTWGGLVITDAEGRRRVDATFASRLEMARSEIPSAILEKMVGGHE
ncbi:MAG: V-type ATP synthase subunit E [Desulfococcaceae bacterium]